MAGEHRPIKQTDERKLMSPEIYFIRQTTGDIFLDRITYVIKTDDINKALYKTLHRAC
jgi:hypothetical protein